eukprot:1933127-Pyramimonas_sp.AAC.1
MRDSVDLAPGRLRPMQSWPSLRHPCEVYAPQVAQKKEATFSTLKLHSGLGQLMALGEIQHATP